ncbi:MAG: PAS domain-containing sensor histidine kinase [Firmicutes bacterium HGW-Firmicutes-14]|nr:MAG: PAS domain-containing sensor histidine kinase [Firmicutes bacterium HGW-Firmicutes-14]
MINRSLVGRLWFAMVVLVILVMFFLGIFLSNFFEDFYFSLKTRELIDYSQKLAVMISSAPDREGWESELSIISKYIDAKIIIVDRRGLIRECTIQGRGMHRGQKIEYPEIERILQGETVVNRGIVPGLDVTVLTIGVPVENNGEIIGAVFFLSPVEPVTQTVRTVQSYILYGAMGTIILATVLGFIMSKKITKPVLDMNRVAKEMAKGNFNERITTESEDEIGLLGNSLNHLSSELQKSIEALSTEKDQLKNILASMTDAVVTFDVNGNILLMNDPAVELFSIKERDKGINIESISGMPELNEQFNLAMKEKSHIKSEIPFNGKIFKTGVTPLRNDKGDIKGIVAVLHDITREKRLESLRREFVANVSHELRSPLSLLQGYVEALADGLAGDEKERQKYLDILLEETHRLRRLVNDLLDLTQMQTGNMNMNFDRVSIKELVNRVTDKFTPLFTEQNKKLGIFVEEDLPPAWGDEDKLQQVMINLLDNAVKYTPENGTVKVDAFAREDTIYVSVEDSGPGIAKDDLELIWERFYKVDKARTREEKGGTGLGLAIVKNIIDAHGGNVSAESEPGKGTKITFSINTTIKKHP